MNKRKSYSCVSALPYCYGWRCRYGKGTDSSNRVSDTNNYLGVIMTDLLKKQAIRGYRTRKEQREAGFARVETWVPMELRMSSRILFEMIMHKEAEISEIHRRIDELRKQL